MWDVDCGAIAGASIIISCHADYDDMPIIITPISMSYRWFSFFIFDTFSFSSSMLIFIDANIDDFDWCFFRFLSFSRKDDFHFFRFLRRRNIFISPIFDVNILFRCHWCRCDFIFDVADVSMCSFDYYWFRCHATLHFSLIFDALRLRFSDFDYFSMLHFRLRRMIDVDKHCADVMISSIISIDFFCCDAADDAVAKSPDYFFLLRFFDFHKHYWFFSSFSIIFLLSFSFSLIGVSWGNIFHQFFDWWLRRRAFDYFRCSFAIYVIFRRYYWHFFDFRWCASSPIDWWDFSPLSFRCRVIFFIDWLLIDKIFDEIFFTIIDDFLISLMPSRFISASIATLCEVNISIAAAFISLSISFIFDDIFISFSINISDALCFDYYVIDWLMWDFIFGWLRLFRWFLHFDFRQNFSKHLFFWCGNTATFSMCRRRWCDYFISWYAGAYADFHFIIISLLFFISLFIFHWLLFRFYARWVDYFRQLIDYFFFHFRWCKDFSASDDTPFDWLSPIDDWFFIFIFDDFISSTLMFLRHFFSRGFFADDESFFDAISIDYQGYADFSRLMWCADYWFRFLRLFCIDAADYFRCAISLFHCADADDASYWYWFFEALWKMSWCAFSPNIVMPFMLLRLLFFHFFSPMWNIFRAVIYFHGADVSFYFDAGSQDRDFRGKDFIFSMPRSFRFDFFVNIDWFSLWFLSRCADFHWLISSIFRQTFRFSFSSFLDFFCAIAAFSAFIFSSASITISLISRRFFWCYHADFLLIDIFHWYVLIFFAFSWWLPPLSFAFAIVASLLLRRRHFHFFCRLMLDFSIFRRYWFSKMPITLLSGQPHFRWFSRFFWLLMLIISRPFSITPLSRGLYFHYADFDFFDWLFFIFSMCWCFRCRFFLSMIDYVPDVAGDMPPKYFFDASPADIFGLLSSSLMFTPIPAFCRLRLIFISIDYAIFDADFHYFIFFFRADFRRLRRIIDGERADISMLIFDFHFWLISADFLSLLIFRYAFSDFLRWLSASRWYVASMLDFRLTYALRTFRVSISIISSIAFSALP